MPAWSRRKFLSVLPALAFASLARAEVRPEGIHPKRIELVARDEGFVLSGGFEVQLNDKLEDALRRGVTITFVQEFDLKRPREYWFDEGIAEASRTLRLGYNALLRSFTLGVGGIAATYDSLPEALAAAGSLADWQGFDCRQVWKTSCKAASFEQAKRSGQKTVYRARVRMYVDISQLPKPLQVNAFASDRWQMDSGSMEWTFKP